jgi:hypothetical protein
MDKESMHMCRDSAPENMQPVAGAQDCAAAFWQRDMQCPHDGDTVVARKRSSYHRYIRSQCACRRDDLFSAPHGGNQVNVFFPAQQSH